MHSDRDAVLRHRQAMEASERLSRELMARDRSPQETYAQWIALQREFEPELQRTEATFRPQRFRDIAALQARLHQAALRLQQHGTPDAVSPQRPDPA